MMPGQVQIPCDLPEAGLPTGARKSRETAKLTMRNQPAATEPTAQQDHRHGHYQRRLRAGGGRAARSTPGCAPAPPSTPFSSQRFAPNQVISMTRLM